MDTPSLSHITADDYDDVYEPAEDSFLMLDALECEIEFLTEIDPSICVEVGPGSGINITAFAKRFRRCFCYCVDVNRRACEVSSATSVHNGVSVDCINGDLLRSVRNGSADVIIFNPPYVVTESSEIGGGITAAWAGGINGREVIDQFLPLLGEVLSQRGVCYMLVIEENRVDEIETFMKDQGFETTVVIERKARNEKLKVLKFERRTLR